MRFIAMMRIFIKIKMTIKTPKIKMICFPRKKIKMTHLHMELQELRKQKLRKGN